MGGSDAHTHLELAAIFAALIAVTTLFSFVSLGANGMTGSSSPDLGIYPVCAAGEPCLEPVGEVTGSSSVPGHSGTFVDTVAVRVAHTGRGDPVDLARTTVTVMAGTYLEILAPSGDVPLQPGTWSAATPGGDNLLSAGEECTIHLHLDRPIPAGESVTVLVRPEGNAPCSITGPAGAPASSSPGKG
jgi:archaellin